MFSRTKIKSNARLLFLGALCMGMATPANSQIRVLVFRGFFGYQHSALITATTVIRNQLPTLLGTTPAFTVDTAIAPTALTPANLANYQVLVLNNNTGLGGLTTAQKSAVLAYGDTRGVVALHSTADFGGGGSWPEMVNFLSASLSGHTAAMGTLNMEPGQASHPINAGLGTQYRMNEEWYGYPANPRNTAGVQILWTIDETSMTWTAGDMPGNDHAIAWTKILPGGGRMFYTAQGHRDSIMERNAHARRLVYNAILWAANASPTQVNTAFQRSNDGFSIVADKASLRITFSQEGGHSLAVHTTNGRRVFSGEGSGVAEYSIPGLKSGTLYVVSGRSRFGKFSKLASTL